LASILFWNLLKNCMYILGDSSLRTAWMFAYILCQLVEIIYTHCWSWWSQWVSHGSVFDLQVKYGKVCTLWYDAVGSSGIMGLTLSSSTHVTKVRCVFISLKSWFNCFVMKLFSLK
jgi:hypothetical protein